jgi:hypothetical protein
VRQNGQRHLKRLVPPLGGVLHRVIDKGHQRSQLVCGRALTALKNGNHALPKEQGVEISSGHPAQYRPSPNLLIVQQCVAAAIRRRAGRLSEYLGPRLFEPLGIDKVAWFCLPPGREQGFSGLFARTEDVAKLGRLYLQRGRWGNHQLIPEGYVAQATSPAVPTPMQENVDWCQGFGYWMSRHGYRGDGGLLSIDRDCACIVAQYAVVSDDSRMTYRTTGRMTRV